MSVLRLLILLIAFSTSPTLAFADGPAEAFYDHFVGTTIDEGAGEIEKRDLDVHIRPYRNGFNIEWTTTIHRASGKTKRASFSINFRPPARSVARRSVCLGGCRGRCVDRQHVDYS